MNRKMDIETQKTEEFVLPTFARCVVLWMLVLGYETLQCTAAVSAVWCVLSM